MSSTAPDDPTGPATSPGADSHEFLSPDQILERLDPEQREVALALDGPVCVLAGAGTGKTRAITHRIAYAVRSGKYPVNSILAVTFTARAAGEMRERLRDLGVPRVQARTFHAAALRQLRFFWPRVVGGPVPDILPHKISAVAGACSALGMRVDRAALRDIAAEIEWAKVSMVLPDDYPAAAAGRDGVAGFDATSIARIMSRYEELKTDAGRIDFEDVLVLLQGMLVDRPDVAREVRSQYSHFVVDEYQDVSPLQHRLLQSWLGGSESLCVVGDASQTIYSFTGATSTYLTGFAAEHPGAKVLRLERNYRSTPEVIEAANHVLDSARDRTAGNRLTLRSQQESGPAPRYVEFPDDVSEAEGVAERIAELIGDGVPASRMAVLFRTNAQSENVEDALSSRDIGYLVRGGERFFDRTEVRTALVALKAAAKATDPGADPVAVVRDVLSSRGWSAEPPAGSGAVRERWDSLNALVQAAATVAQRPGTTYADIVADLLDRAESQNAPEVDGVTLASIHAAKGLEWDAVFVIGATEGLIPISMAKDDAAVEEERRLFYVALTRARTYLQVSWSLARSQGARASRTPSRFLEALTGPGPGTGPRRSARPHSRRSGSRRSTLFSVCRVCGKPLETGAEKKVGRCSSCPPSYDEATFDELRAWRKRLAGEQSVPAYVVFTDATLTAIAERDPLDLPALAQIPGVGARKLERYGDEVLSLLAAHRKR